MATIQLPLRCFIGSLSGMELDQWLRDHEFGSGLLLFAIPDFGVLFKCRAFGDPIDLEFGACLAALKFIDTSLKTEQISKVLLISSNPEFLFALSGTSRHLVKGSERDKLLDEHRRKRVLAAAFIERHRNCVYLPTHEFPSLPDGRKIKVAGDWSAGGRPVFKPWQKGISL